ncbi:MAG: precorrin-6A reductase [Lachnospiraceae bacterium]|nr:precorrin-6A reductase [Lachnospiraceae bacterium]
MRILLFGGTTEGRLLAEAIAEYGRPGGQGTRPADLKDVCHVCVATDYGAALLEEEEGLVLHKERLDAAGMEELIRNVGFDICIDATHPYAVEVSSNIRHACKACGLRLFRIGREDTVPRKDEHVYAGSVREAAEYLKDTEGNILITTGSKELKEYTVIRDFKQRCYVRILPSPEAVEACIGLGFMPKNIICMQGPFGYGLNLEMLRAAGARYLVTKASGSEGGYPDKYRAAADAGVRLIVVGRPKEENEKVYSFDEIIKFLGLGGCAALKKSSDTMHKKAYIIGAGCGDPCLMTGRAVEALMDADCIIGAGRLINELIKAAEKGSDIMGIPAAALTRGKQLVTEYDRNRIERYIKENSPKNVALIYSGDIGIYSGALGIGDMPEGYEKIRIPGISSGIYLCDKLGISWQDARFLSCHGRELDIDGISDGCGKLVIFLGEKEDAGRICTKLCTDGKSGHEVFIGERLSYPDEKITKGRAVELTDAVTDPLAVMLVVSGQGGNRPALTDPGDGKDINGS